MRKRSGANFFPSFFQLKISFFSWYKNEGRENGSLLNPSLTISNWSRRSNFSFIFTFFFLSLSPFIFFSFFMLCECVRLLLLSLSLSLILNLDKKIITTCFFSENLHCNIPFFILHSSFVLSIMRTKTKRKKSYAICKWKTPFPQKNYEKKCENKAIKTTEKLQISQGRLVQNQQNKLKFCQENAKKCYWFCFNFLIN